MAAVPAAGVGGDVGRLPRAPAGKIIERLLGGLHLSARWRPTNGIGELFGRVAQIIKPLVVRQPGNVIVDVIQQFDLTYDLYSLTGRQILRLLPDEFRRWSTA